MRNGLQEIAHRFGQAARTLWGGAPSGQVYAFDPKLDTLRLNLTKALTFSRLESILASADAGYITDALTLFEQMERRDPRLRSVANTRRLALTGLDWEIVSAAEVQRKVSDKNLADDTAAYVADELDDLPGFLLALNHLATAIGPNLAVLELVWDYQRLVKVTPIPSWRLTMELQKGLDIRVITAEERTQGIPAVGPKWVIHVPDCVSGSPLSNSLIGAQAWLWLIKKLALSDWATFAELFGIPIRVGRYTPSATPAERDALKDMLKNIGSAAWAMVSQGVQIEFVESSQRGISPFEALMNYCGREQSILWLGGNLTSDTTGGTGTFAAADTQNQVREDLRDDDIKREAATIREQILAPMVTYRFGSDAPVPYFRRVKPETIDRIREADLFAKAQQAGLKIGQDYAYERLGIQKPEPDEAVLEPSLDAFGEGLQEGLGGDL